MLPSTASRTEVGVGADQVITGKRGENRQRTGGQHLD
jgi:hypothetical protein